MFTLNHLPEAYAAWDTGDLLVEYMKMHQNHWPRSWDDLLTVLDSESGRELILWGSRAGDIAYARALRNKVRVDWNFDPCHSDLRNPVSRPDGSPFPVVWQDAEPNQLWRPRVAAVCYSSTWPSPRVALPATERYNLYCRMTAVLAIHGSPLNSTGCFIAASVFACFSFFLFACSRFPILRTQIRWGRGGRGGPISPLGCFGCGLSFGIFSVACFGEAMKLSITHGRQGYLCVISVALMFSGAVGDWLYYRRGR
jgi:hypothetical protein